MMHVRATILFTKIHPKIFLSFKNIVSFVLEFFRKVPCLGREGNVAKRKFHSPFPYINVSVRFVVKETFNLW